MALAVDYSSYNKCAEHDVCSRMNENGMSREWHKDYVKVLEVDVVRACVCRHRCERSFEWTIQRKTTTNRQTARFFHDVIELCVNNTHDYSWLLVARGNDNSPLECTVTNSPISNLLENKIQKNRKYSTFRWHRVRMKWFSHVNALINVTIRFTNKITMSSLKSTANVFNQFFFSSSSSLSLAIAHVLNQIKCVSNLIYCIDIEYEYDTYGPFDWIKWFFTLSTYLSVYYLHPLCSILLPTKARTYFMISFTHTHIFIYLFMLLFAKSSVACMIAPNVLQCFTHDSVWMHFEWMQARHVSDINIKFKYEFLTRLKFFIHFSPLFGDQSLLFFLVMRQKERVRPKGENPVVDVPLHERVPQI